MQNKLKEETKKLLSDQGLRIWGSIQWDTEEVGSSKTGFLDVDPGIKPEKIADFINRKAEKLAK